MEKTLRAEAGSVRQARNLVMARLIDAGCTIETIEKARLVTSELATNAVRHASGDRYTVDVDVDHGVLRVEILDDDPSGSVEPGRPRPEAEGGRGLWLVDVLAQRWGVRPTPSGKAVWFQMAC